MRFCGGKEAHKTYWTLRRSSVMLLLYWNCCMLRLEKRKKWTREEVLLNAYSLARVCVDSRTCVFIQIWCYCGSRSIGPALLWAFAGRPPATTMRWVTVRILIHFLGWNLTLSQQRRRNHGKIFLFEQTNREYIQLQCNIKLCWPLH